MTVSHWRRAHPPASAECDVLVVGAGICGVSAALALQRRGVRAEVVERCGLASGASGRNAGFLMRGAADNYKLAVDHYGRELARLIWRWTEENLEGLRHEGIETLPSVRRIPSCLLALEPGELAELRASLDLLREDGFQVGWIDRGDDAAWRHAKPLGGLLNPNDASCNPVDLMRLLASRLQRPILDHQEVVSIQRAGGALTVRTTDLLFRCGRVLLCTNAYAPLLVPALEGVIVPRRGQMIALRNTGFRLDCSYYANRGSEYFRTAHDGTVVVGGCRTYVAERETGYDDRVTDWVQGPIEAFAKRVLGVDRLDITARWAGIMGFSPDGLPLVGPVPGKLWDTGDVWFCGGFTGHGMSLAYRTAHAAVASMLDGAPNPLPLDRVSRPSPRPQPAGAAP